MKQNKKVADELMDAEDRQESMEGVAPSPGEERSELAMQTASNTHHTERSKAIGHNHANPHHTNPHPGTM